MRSFGRNTGCQKRRKAGRGGSAEAWLHWHAVRCHLRAPEVGRTPKVDEGSQLAIVFKDSPLFAGDAGSGENDIRGWTQSQRCLRR